MNERSTSELRPAPVCGTCSRPSVGRKHSVAPALRIAKSLKSLHTTYFQNTYQLMLLHLFVNEKF